MRGGYVPMANKSCNKEWDRGLKLCVGGHDPLSCCRIVEVDLFTQSGGQTGPYNALHSIQSECHSHLSARERHQKHDSRIIRCDPIIMRSSGTIEIAPKYMYNDSSIRWQ
jgi:hypothetical protein